MIQIKEVTNTINNEEFINKNYLRRRFTSRLCILLDDLQEDILNCRDTVIVTNTVSTITACMIDANFFGIISDDEFEDLIEAFGYCIHEKNDNPDASHDAVRLVLLTALKDYITEKIC